LIHALKNSGAFQQQSGICIGIQLAEFGFEAFPIVTKWDGIEQNQEKHARLMENGRSTRRQGINTGVCIHM
jgi:hypothetical protein